MQASWGLLRDVRQCYGSGEVEALHLTFCRLGGGHSGAIVLELPDAANSSGVYDGCRGDRSIRCRRLDGGPNLKRTRPGSREDDSLSSTRQLTPSMSQCGGWPDNADFTFPSTPPLGRSGGCCLMPYVNLILTSGFDIG